jgi:hypothetical protein
MFAENSSLAARSNVSASWQTDFLRCARGVMIGDDQGRRGSADVNNIASWIAGKAFR